MTRQKLGKKAKKPLRGESQLTSTYQKEAYDDNTVQYLTRNTLSNIIVESAWSAKIMIPIGKLKNMKHNDI